MGNEVMSILSPRYFASRTRWDFTENKLSQALARLRKRGKTILDLTQSNPTDCDIEYPPGLLKVLADAQNLRYQPSAQGLLKARQAIAREYQKQGAKVNPQDILLTASTSEAYSFVLRLLVNPGERVLFPSPSYPLLDHLAQINDVQVDRYALRYDGSWYTDMKSVERAVTKDTRAMVVIHPNNPTGSYLKWEEWKKLKRICKAHKLAIISDEVFRDYSCAADKNRIGTVAGDSEVLGFAFNGISKMLGLPQMKIAWICVGGPAGQRNEALKRLEMIADTYLSVNTPAQHALPHWLKFKKRMQRQILGRVLANRRLLDSRDWSKHGCEVLSAEGGWYALLRVPSTRTEEEWALRLLQNKGVLVHPGYFFDFESQAYLVLSLLPKPGLFFQAVVAMQECIGEG